jgi:hypothetical protein
MIWFFVFDNYADTAYSRAVTNISGVYIICGGLLWLS